MLAQPYVGEDAWTPSARTFFELFQTNHRETTATRGTTARWENEASVGRFRRKHLCRFGMERWLSAEGIGSPGSGISTANIDSRTKLAPFPQCES